MGFASKMSDKLVHSAILRLTYFFLYGIVEELDIFESYKPNRINKLMLLACLRLFSSDAFCFTYVCVHMLNMRQ